MRAVAAVALGFEGDVELMGQGQARERQAHAVGFGQGDAHVFDEVLDEEAGIEIVGDDPRAEIRQRPAAGRAGRDRLQHGRQVEARFVAVQQRFADADHVGGDQHLVDHLGVLAGAGAALMDDRLAHRFPAGLQALRRLPCRRRS